MKRESTEAPTAPASEQLTAPSITAADLRYASRPQDLRPDNRLVPLRDGRDTYPAMLEAIANARESINLETYILRADSIGEKFGDALKERAKAGVAVRVIYDSFGSLGIDDEFLNDWRNAGIEIAEYNPIAPWRRRFSLTRRNHRKILVVDDRIAFTGGLNIGKEYAAVDEGGGGWRDMHVMVEGPVVADLATLFHTTWLKCDGADYTLRPEVALEPRGSSLAQVVNNREFKDRFRFRRAYLRAIRNALSSIDIMNAYFLPGMLMRRTLRKAIERGVQVRVIVPGQSDVKFVQMACEHMYKWFFKAGMKIYEWPDRMMHAKTAVIDSAWSTIGSYNLDNQSLLQNLEVAVAVLDRPFSAHMTDEFENDVARSKEITLAEYEQRGRWRRFSCWLAYQVRRWL